MATVAVSLSVSMASCSNSTAGPASTSSTDLTGPSKHESSEYESEFLEDSNQIGEKHRVAVSLSHNGKCRKPPQCRSDSKTVSPEMHVKSFPKECFLVSAGKLFCNACREELMYIVSVKDSVLQQHVEVLNTQKES